MTYQLDGDQSPDVACTVFLITPSIATTSKDVSGSTVNFMYEDNGYKFSLCGCNHQSLEILDTRIHHKMFALGTNDYH
jgi:hypothetical protein